MTADVRVAVVGAGRWAQVAHIPGWQRDPRADVVALADVNETVLADVASKFGVTRVTTDYRELLDDPGIDVIAVGTGTPGRPRAARPPARCPPSSGSRSGTRPRSSTRSP